jgi:hypothetical protein
MINHIKQFDAYSGYSAFLVLLKNGDGNIKCSITLFSLLRYSSCFHSPNQFQTLHDSAWQKPVIVQNIKTTEYLLLPSFIKILLMEIAFCQSCCYLVFYRSFRAFGTSITIAIIKTFSIGICQLLFSIHYSVPLIG